MRYRTVLTLLLSCFFSHLAWPQAVGTISGIVEDENAKPVAKANVHIAQTESFSGHHVVRFYETDDGGKFTISHVPWGTYIVMAGKEEDGFADTLAAFYSNLEAPTVVLGPLFPSADVVVRLG